MNLHEVEQVMDIMHNVCTGPGRNGLCASVCGRGGIREPRPRRAAGNRHWWDVACKLSAALAVRIISWLLHRGLRWKGALVLRTRGGSFEDCGGKLMPTGCSAHQVGPIATTPTHSKRIRSTCPAMSGAPAIGASTAFRLGHHQGLTWQTERFLHAYPASIGP